MKRTPIPRKRAKPRRVSVVRSPEYREYVRTICCTICEKLCRTCGGKCIGQGDCVGVWCDAAHTTNNGMSSKGGDDTCAPLCRVHHAEYDADRKAFERKYGVDMKAVAKAWWELFNRRKV